MPTRIMLTLNELAMERTELGQASVVGYGRVGNVLCGGLVLRGLAWLGLLLVGLLLCVLILLVLLTGDASY